MTPINRVKYYRCHKLVITFHLPLPTKRCHRRTQTCRCWVRCSPGQFHRRSLQRQRCQITRRHTAHWCEATLSTRDNFRRYCCKPTDAERRHRPADPLSTMWHVSPLAEWHEPGKQLTLHYIWAGQDQNLLKQTCSHVT